MSLRPFVCLSYALVHLSLLATGLAIGGEIDGVAFFRATKDRNKFSKNPEKYERVTVKAGGISEVHYVDRRATYAIKDRMIKAVIVKKLRKYGSSPQQLRELAEEAYGRSSKSIQKNRPEHPLGYSYSLSFRITLEEGDRFISFANANMKQIFNVRIFDKSVGMLSFELPFEEQTTEYVEFTVPLQDENANKVKELMSPFPGRVVWE